MKKKIETTSAAGADAPPQPLQMAALPSLEKQQIWHVPVRDITPSPFQPRQEFPADELDQLRASIAAHGIQIPLLGRRKDADADAVELIAGERRWRCAQALALDTVPMIVRTDLSDDEVIRIQRVENAGRENLKALEAAEDYALLQSQGRPVDEIMTLHGVGRSHVFTRLRVAKLPAEIKQLIKDGKLSITIADLIAKLPTVKLQQEVAQRFTEARPDYLGELTFRQAAEIIEEEYTRNLSGAPWKHADADLLPSAGACSTCPKRSGNLEGNTGSPHLCTDVACYEQKQTAHTMRVLQQAEASGQRTIPAAEYQKHSYSYELATEECYDDEKKERTWGELAAKAGITPAITVNQDGRAIEVFTKEDRAAILKAHQLDGPKQYERDRAADRAKREAEAKALDEAITAAVLAASAEVDIEGKKPLPMTTWRRLAKTVLDGLHNHYLPEALFKGRGLTFHKSDPETNRLTLFEYIDQQVTPHNLLGLMVHTLADAKVNHYNAELLMIWGVDWKQYLPGAKPKRPTKPAKKAKEKPKAKPKAAKARRSQTAATNKKI